MSEEQFAETVEMREATVVLSDRMWNVLFIVADTNVASVIGPPGRLELSGRPYWHPLTSVNVTRQKRTQTHLCIVNVVGAVSKSGAPYYWPKYKWKSQTTDAATTIKTWVSTSVYPKNLSVRIFIAMWTYEILTSNQRPSLLFHHLEFSQQKVARKVSWWPFRRHDQTAKPSWPFHHLWNLWSIKVTFSMKRASRWILSLNLSCY